MVYLLILQLPCRGRMFEKNLDPQRDGYATYDNSGSKSITFAILESDISMENHTESILIVGM